MRGGDTTTDRNDGDSHVVEMPRDLLVEELYSEWLDLYRDGEGDDFEAFIAQQAEDCRPLLKERICEHLRLAEIFHGKNKDIEPGLLVDEEFELIRELGAGASAVVWEARQRSLNRRVAIKFLRLPLALLSDRARERFHREGRILAGIQHPGLVAVYASGCFGAVPYLVEELVPESNSLSELLDSLGEEQREGATLGSRHDRHVAAWFMDAAEALAAVHAEGILHRDVKPANILIGGDGRARVIDFGLAQVDDQHELTEKGELLGTTLYMNPEQLKGDSDEVGARSDMFSLGITLYEALTLQRPFYGDSVALIREKIKHHDAPNPRTIRSRIPQDLAIIVLKMIEKNPAHRYLSMEAVVSDLAAFLAGEPIHAVPPGSVRRSWRWLRRRPQLMVGIGVGMLLAGALYALLLVGVEKYKGLAQKHEKELGEKEETVQRLKQLDQLGMPKLQGMPTRNQGLAILITQLEAEPVFFDLDRGAPRGQSVLQFNVRASTLHSLCKEETEASLSLRARGYRLLIEACIGAYLHEEARVLVGEAEKLGMTDKELGEFPVYYKALIKYEVGMYHLAVRGFSGWLTNHHDLMEPLQKKLNDKTLTLSELRGCQESIRDLQERRDVVLTKLLIAALRGDMERDLLRFRTRFEDPQEFLAKRMEELLPAWPKEHPRVVEVGLAQGLLFLHFRQWREAEEHLGKLYQAARENPRLMGEDHPLTRTLQLDWAFALARTEDFTSAVVEIEEVLDWWREISNAENGEPHLNTLIPEWRLAWALLEQHWRMPEGEQREATGERAIRLYTEVVEEMEEQFGPRNLNTLQAKTGYGILLAARDRHDEAIRVLEESLEVKEGVLGEQNISTLISYRALYQAYEAKAEELEEGERSEEASAMYRTLIKYHLIALELQSERDGFHSMAENDAGYCEHERAMEFTRFGTWYLERYPSYVLEREEPERIRRIAKHLVGLHAAPGSGEDEGLRDSKKSVAEFLRKHDPSPEGQEVAHFLEAALSGPR